VALDVLDNFAAPVAEQVRSDLVAASGFGACRRGELPAGNPRRLARAPGFNQNPHNRLAL
jgi:hypothetical protein